jgi:N-hydroxyarylamine O-acetyltransferase
VNTIGGGARDDPFIAYLARLGLDARPPPTWATLADLVRRHTETVPFENVDIFRGRPVVLGTDVAVHKVAHRRRGGFCYEMNEAFRALLDDLGFVTRRIEGQVWREKSDTFGAPFDHLLLAVALPEGDFLVDVGFGDNNRRPLRMPEDTAEDVSGRYRLSRLDADTLQLDRLADDGTVRPLYRMSLATRDLADFAGMCAYHQTSPDSIFMSGLIATRATPDGRISLTGDRLVETSNGAHTETRIAAVELPALLAAHFGIGPD